MHRFGVLLQCHIANTAILKLFLYNFNVQWRNLAKTQVHTHSISYLLWNFLQSYIMSTSDLFSVFFSAIRTNFPTACCFLFQGIFSKMTFRDDVFLGGHRNLTSIRSRVGSSVGFTGCVRSLLINNKSYDMRKGVFAGDASYGLDVG